MSVATHALKNKDVVPLLAALRVLGRERLDFDVAMRLREYVRVVAQRHEDIRAELNKLVELHGQPVLAKDGEPELNHDGTPRYEAKEYLEFDEDGEIVSEYNPKWRDYTREFNALMEAPFSFTGEVKVSELKVRGADGKRQLIDISEEMIEGLGTMLTDDRDSAKKIVPLNRAGRRRKRAG